VNPKRPPAHCAPLSAGFPYLAAAEGSQLIGSCPDGCVGVKSYTMP
jgi:hypothetical protein